MRKLLVITLLLSSIGFTEDLKLSALAYYEFCYYTNKNSKISNEFEFHRVYFGLENNISKTLSYTFLTDIGRKGNDGQLEVCLKYAKVDWNTKIGKFVIGMQGMNLFDIQKNTWGYRSIEKTAMDKNSWASSADIGLGYYNNFHDLHYNVLMTNGTGFKLPENDSYKKISTQIYYGQGKLNLHDGMNSGLVFTYEPYHAEGESINSKFVAGIFGGYASGPVRIGAEVSQLNDTGFGTTIKIISGYGNYAITNKVDLFTRFDNLNSISERSNYMIAGITISPEKGLKIMPNIRCTSSTNSKNNVNYHLNFEFKM